MQVPLEIAFHNLPSTPWAEDDIRARVAKLEERYNHLIACRVRVEAPHNSQRSGNHYDVHIELSVPGKDLIVSKEPHGLGTRFADPDLQTVIREAFKAAERQLSKFKQRIGGDVKYHEPQFLGQVAQLVEAEDHGFLLTKEGSLLYFHRNSVIDGSFDELELGDKLHYIEAAGDTGPTASKVWRSAGPELV